MRKGRRGEGEGCTDDEKEKKTSLQSHFLLHRMESGREADEEETARDDEGEGNTEQQVREKNNPANPCLNLD